MVWKVDLGKEHKYPDKMIFRKLLNYALDNDPRFKEKSVWYEVVFLVSPNNRIRLYEHYSNQQFPKKGDAYQKYCYNWRYGKVVMEDSRMSDDEIALFCHQIHPIIIVGHGFDVNENCY